MDFDPIAMQLYRRTMAEDGSFRGALQRAASPVDAGTETAALPMPTRAAVQQAPAAAPQQAPVEEAAPVAESNEPEMCADCMKSGSDSGTPFVAGKQAA